MSPTYARRRLVTRRRRNEAREHILEAVRRQLEDKPFRDVSVDELMQETNLSRSAFYRYFPDREAVLADLLEEVSCDLAEARDLEGAVADPSSPGSMPGLAPRLTVHRAILKAIADAAPGDEDVERAYRSFTYSCWIDDFTARIVSAQSRGLAAGLDPQLAGEAFGWMAERMITQSLDRDPRQVVDAIIAIVVECLESAGAPSTA